MKQNIYRSAALVTVFSTIEKTLSFFYRVVLSRILGAEGLGIYQICLSVFAVFLTAASSGIPVTVSRLMAKNGAAGDIRGKNSAVTAGVVATLVFTVPIAVILFFRAFRAAFCGRQMRKYFLTASSGARTHLDLFGNARLVLGE